VRGLGAREGISRTTRGERARTGKIREENVSWWIAAGVFEARVREAPQVLRLLDRRHEEPSAAAPCAVRARTLPTVSPPALHNLSGHLSLTATINLPSIRAEPFDTRRTAPRIEPDLGGPMSLNKLISRVAFSTAVAAFAAFALAAEPAPAKAPTTKPAYPLTTCVVSGEKLGEMGKPHVIQYEGREVQFCCPRCEKEFKKDPAKYLKKIDAAAKKPATKPSK
jgi:YHS domain-containing protein